MVMCPKEREDLMLHICNSITRRLRLEDTCESEVFPVWATLRVLVVLGYSVNPCLKAEAGGTSPHDLRGASGARTTFHNGCAPLSQRTCRS